MATHNNNDFISVAQIFGDQFIIPTYQRGYRWTRSQIEDLLNDFKDFAENKSPNDYYCLQPLVIAEDEDGRYRLIDGQQRLTTIWLLLLCMDVICRQVDIKDNTSSFKGAFKLEFERTDILGTIAKLDFSLYERFDGKPLVKDNINNSAYQYWDNYVDAQWKIFSANHDKSVINVESFHLFAGWLFIHNWLEFNKDSISNSLFDSIRLIWHRVGLGKEEEEAFINLNGGKIPLTNAELIKALFLNSYGKSGNNNQLQQDIIAEEYDAIERELRKDDFWYFLNGRGSKPTSCISLIFSLIQNLDNDHSHEGQEYRNYFYFRDKISSLHTANCMWEKIRDVFHTLQGWYNTPEIYNLIGYLRAINIPIEVIYRAYLKCKTTEQFKKYLKHRCLVSIGWFDRKLEKEREEDFDGYLHNNFRFDTNKERAWNLLLLINVITLNIQKSEAKDHKRDITKFSFSDFHNCEWNIEHISPQNAVVSQGMIIPGVETLPAEGEKLHKIDDKKIKGKIDPYVAVLNSSIMDISNLTFLSEHINKSIGNKPYDEKRECVIDKQSKGLYLPPSSLMIFTKGYNSRAIQSQSLSEGKMGYWSDLDRKAYFCKIRDILRHSYFADAMPCDDTDETLPKNYDAPLFSQDYTYSHKIDSLQDSEPLERLTYTQLLARNKYIIIPKIQRDYAQGRSKNVDARAAIIRRNLLSDIFSMKDDGIDFQIVFGSEELRKEISEDNSYAKVFIPIDGQQRLSTLFLLYLYRDKLNNVNNPVRFIYETRKAATDFCVALVKQEWIGFPDIAPKESILNSTWFKQYWLQDPTVDAMLRMLNDIHYYCENSASLPDLEKIHFSYFNIGLASHSDEIYLKMNTRGKELTQFENLKATIEKEFGDSQLGNLWIEWKKNIDSIWLDAFWSNNNPTLIPDSRILRYIANTLFVKICSDKSLHNLSSLNEIDIPQDVTLKTEIERANKLIRDIQKIVN